MRDLLPVAKPPAADLDQVRFCLAGRFEEARNVALHAHPFHELILVYRGRCRIQVGKQPRYLESGDLILIPEHEPHDQEADDVVRTLYVGAAWPQSMLSTQPRIISMGSDRFVQQWMSDLADLYKNEHAIQTLATQGLLIALLGRIRRVEDGLRRQREHHPQFVAAVHWIEAHVTQTLSVKQIAEHVGCSAGHLTALFRQEMGCGPITYQIQCRLQLACKHLLEPYLNVSQIAAACGWNDPNLFVRIFRNRMGCPPGAWRKRQQSVSTDHLAASR